MEQVYIGYMISIEKFDGGKTIKAFEVFFDMALKNNR